MTNEARIISPDEFLGMYAQAFWACTDPVPYLDRDGVNLAFRETAYAVLDSVKKYFPDGGVVPVVGIPRGGIGALDIIELLISAALRSWNATFHRIEMPVSKYGDGGTVGRVPGLPDGFEFATEDIKIMKDNTVLLIEDMVESDETTGFARNELMTNYGVKRVPVHVVFARDPIDSIYYPVERIGHVITIKDWVQGGHVMDSTFGVGRTTPELHAVYSTVINPGLTDDQLGELDPDILARRNVFQNIIGNMHNILVDGVPAREYIETLPSLSYPQLMDYLSEEFRAEFDIQ